MDVHLPESIIRVKDGLVFNLQHWINAEDSKLGYYYYASKEPFEELAIGTAMFQLETGLYQAL